MRLAGPPAAVKLLNFRPDTTIWSPATNFASRESCTQLLDVYVGVVLTFAAALPVMVTVVTVLSQIIESAAGMTI